jgi:ADP-heptose:LPS heptosyltransferase
MIKVLVQRADRLGDVLFSLPIIDQLKTLPYPVQIDYFVSPSGKDLVAQHPDIHTYHVYTPESQTQLTQTIRDNRYAIYLCLWNHPHLLALGKAAKIPMRIGHAGRWQETRYLTHTVPTRWDNLITHMIEHNTALLAPLGLPTVCQPGSLPIPSKNPWPDAKHKVALFTQTGGSNIPFPKRTIDTFIHRMNHQEPDTKIVLLGHDPDSPFLTTTGPTIINAINQTSFETLLAWIAHCDTYIGPDTGPTHVASLYNKPTVFFSPLKINPPGTFGSLSNRQVIIRHDTQYPKLRLTTDDYPHYLGYLTDEYLYTAYQQLHALRPMTPTEIRTLHGYTTLRILYFPFPGETPDYTAYTHAHFPVFTAEKSWRTLCSQLVTHNISVLYGDVPRTLGKCLQWYMGIAQQIVQPVIIRRPLPESPQDVLHNYRQARS